MVDERTEDLPIWQNHEQRITTLEITTRNIKSEFEEVKSMINDGNREQSEKLDFFYKRLTDEFFKKKNRNHENTWNLFLKIVGSLLGAGSFIYVLIDMIGG